MTNNKFRPTLFKNLSPGQKKDISLVDQHLNYYKDETAEGADHPEYKMFVKLLRTLSEQENAKEAKIKALMQLVEDHDLYYVTKDDKIYACTTTGSMYEAFSIASICRNLGVDLSSMEALTDAIRRLNRSKKKVWVSYGKTPDDYLNLLTKKQWLEPSDDYKDDDKFWMDLLLDSISGQKKKVRDHIEQCIAYKYLHPETYELPMWLPYGAGSGGAGKNVFVASVLKAIWGDLVLVAPAKDIVGDWTGCMLGKIFILIDENIKAQNDFEKFKAIVGNETIDVNFKGGMKLNDMPNTAMYMMTANSAICPIKLTDTAIDRRFAVWEIQHNIIELLCERRDLPYGRSDDDRQEVLELWAENKSRYHNKEVVAGWLGAIIKKWGHLKSPPSPVRGDDYTKAINDHKGPLENSYEDVFNQQDFDFIAADTLYKRYVGLVKRDTPAQHPKGKITYLGDVRGVVALKYPEIEYTSINLHDGEGPFKAWVFIREDARKQRGRKYDNKDKYIGTLDKVLPIYGDGGSELLTPPKPQPKTLAALKEMFAD